VACSGAKRGSGAGHILITSVVWGRHRLAAFAPPHEVRGQNAADHLSKERAMIMIGYDGSDDAKDAIKRVGALFKGQPAVVLVIWE
jgi:hypothetical protein